MRSSQWYIVPYDNYQGTVQVCFPVCCRRLSAKTPVGTNLLMCTVVVQYLVHLYQQKQLPSTPYIHRMDQKMRVTASKAVPFLLPTTVIFMFLSLYHGNLLTQQNCITENTHVAIGLSSGTTHATSAVAERSTGTESDYVGPYKVYQKWTEPFPCFPAEKSWKSVATQRSPSHTGLLYTREMKTGSSTLTGVILRLAHRKAKTLLPDSDLPCKLRIDHSSATSMDYANRDKKKSFLMSLLRDPTKRTMSHVCHHILCTFILFISLSS